MAGETCASCGSPIANTTVTGILCDACHARDVTPQPGWKSYFTGPTYVGIVGVLVPWFIHFAVNGLDYVAVGGGAVGVLAALAGLGLAFKAAKDERTKKLIPAIVVLLLGLLDLRASGLFMMF